MKTAEVIAMEYLSTALKNRTGVTLIALLQDYGEQVRQDQRLIDARIVADFANEHRDLGFHSMGKLANLISGES